MSALPRIAIFDLDGTLIDSAPGILEGFGHALKAASITPVVPVEPGLIGPPLAQVMARLSGLDDPQQLAELTGHFKQFYDSTGYLLTPPYPGVQAMLEQLHAQGVALHLATNKRHAPTVKILEALGWLPLFTSVYALDRDTPAYADKCAMLRGQLANERIAAADALYIGDRDEDRHAAEGAGLPFVAVSWGYGEFAPDAAHPVLRRADELPAHFHAKARAGQKNR